MNRIQKLYHYTTTNVFCYLKVWIQHHSVYHKCTSLVIQDMPSAARSMPHLRYLELAANPITTLSSAIFQGAMEHLLELDIRHLTLNYFEVKWSDSLRTFGDRAPRNSVSSPPPPPLSLPTNLNLSKNNTPRMILLSGESGFCLVCSKEQMTSWVTYCIATANLKKL